MSKHSVKFDEDKRHAVYARDGYKCHYCGHADATETGIKLSIDHIDSRASGGEAQNTKHSEGTNLITACHGCNFAKQDKSPREWNAYVKDRGMKVDWSKVRRQAGRRLDIKAGEEGAKRAREARAARDQTAAAPPVAERVGGHEAGEGAEHEGPGIRHDERGRFMPG